MPKEISKIPKIPKWSHHPTSKKSQFRTLFWEVTFSNIHTRIVKNGEQLSSFLFHKIWGPRDPTKTVKEIFLELRPEMIELIFYREAKNYFFRGCKCSVFRPNFWTEFLLALSMLLATTQRHVPTSDFDPILRVPSWTTKSGHLSIYSACPLMVYGLHRKYFPTKLGKKWFRSK